MILSVKFASSAPKSASGTLICLTDEKKTLSAFLKEMDKNLGGLIGNALKNADAFKAKALESTVITLPKDAGYARLALVSCGTGKEMTTLEATKFGAKIYLLLAALKVKAADIHLPGSIADEAELAAHLAQGMALRNYKFDKYKGTTAPDADAVKTLAVTVITGAAAAKKIYADLDTVAASVTFARDLVNEAPNVLYPESYAETIKKELAPLGVKVEILDEKKMEKLGMGAILAVGMGSARPPRMVVMQWNGAGAGSKKKPLGFVGKGVTFDTGGISIKPAANMDEMKMDMGGSAAVVGLIRALARQQAKVDVVGVVGLAENMPSDRAFRPGDMVKSYNGKYIEVLNTDAEGRLVLVDCLTYLQKKYDPSMIVDLATLTGAMMVALAHEYTGAFVNDDQMWQALDQAGKDTGEKLWRMPLDEAYRKDVESDLGDVRNLAKNGRYGGACTAAAFIEHFIDKGRKWAHLDIAGTAWLGADHALGPKGATGVGVRLLERFIQKGKW